MSTPRDEAFNTTTHADADEWRAAQWNPGNPYPNLGLPSPGITPAKDDDQ
ncbi:hypothetical protein GCM10008944_01300 [Cytobacillus oceanisediminis]